MDKPRSWIPFVGFFVFTVLLFLAIHFFQAKETPPWRSSPKSPQESPSASDPPNKAQDTESFRFLAYNVRNWLVSTQSPVKSAESKSAVIQAISDASPDIVGLCEIGSINDVQEIQSLLKKAGLDLPHLHFTGGFDKVRHLAILSRFPISSVQYPPVEIQGKDNFSMQRGILDVVIQINKQPIRFIGLHLKSKRVVPEFDQEFLRAEEARHVRKHIDSILTIQPDTKLLLYGDLNDHIRSPSTRSILGTYRSPTYLTSVTLKDSKGETWTHFFKDQDSYSRIDFVAVSKSLRSSINRKSSRIVDFPEWLTASDHRPLFVSFK